MKKLFVTLVVLCGYSNVSAMEHKSLVPFVNTLEKHVTLPSPIDLVLRLRDHNYPELCAGTNLTTMLANQKMSLSLFIQRISFILTDYFKTNQPLTDPHTSPQSLADLHKSAVMKIILQDQPEALQILRQNGYIQ